MIGQCSAQDESLGLRLNCGFKLCYINSADLLMYLFS